MESPIDVFESSDFHAQLAKYLRTARIAAGLSCQQLGRRVHMSASKISRIETCLLLPDSDDLKMITAALKIGEETAMVIADLERNARNVNMRDKVTYFHGDIRQMQERVKEIERQATDINIIVQGAVPGLLQTPDYTRALMGDGLVKEEELPSFVMERLERQKVLFKQERSFTFLITENALRLRYLDVPGMRMQYHQVLSFFTFPNVRIGVLPAKTRLPISLSLFVHLNFFDAKVILSEHLDGISLMSNAQDVKPMFEKFQKLCQISIWNDEAREFIARLDQELMNEEREDKILDVRNN